MEEIGNAAPETSDSSIGEISKKYEDFTQEDFKRHLEATVHIVETNTRPSREFFESFPILTIHKKQVDGFFVEEPHPEETRLDIGQKVRSLYTKRKDCEDA
jgi:hypothetical protein